LTVRLTDAETCCYSKPSRPSDLSCKLCTELSTTATVKNKMGLLQAALQENTTIYEASLQSFVHALAVIIVVSNPSQTLVLLPSPSAD